MIDPPPPTTVIYEHPPQHLYSYVRTSSPTRIIESPRPRAVSTTTHVYPSSYYPSSSVYYG